MSRVAPFGAALFAAAAALLAQGTMGFASTGGLRLAIVPLSWTSVLLAAGAGLAVLALSRAGASLLPVALLGLLLLPWLPFAVPAAFLLWTGPVAAIVWVAVALLMLSPWLRRVRVVPGDPRRAAAVLTCAILALSAWRAAPMVPGGDEPHYLVITQSLLLDGDLTIEDVHRRGDYRAYYAGDLLPHVQRRGRDGEIYSIHAPGLPVLVAPAFAAGGHPGVVTFLVLLASAGAALAWHLAWLVSRRTDAAWFGWAAVTLPVTAVFQGFTVYPDGPGGILALTGLWALLRADEESRTGATSTTPWLLHGAALALLPWFHSRFAVLAGGFGALVLLRLSATTNPAGKAVAFLSVPAVSAVLWVGFFVAVYGTPDPSAPYGRGEIGSFQFVPGGLGGLLFDQRFGVIAYAPVVACALIGLGLMAAVRAHRRLAVEILFVAIPYLLTVTHFAMWWGGWSVPARFFAPILPLMVVPATLFWTLASGRAARVLASAALVLTAVASATLVWVDRGRLAFNTREAPALWLEWAGRLADLTAAAPLWARESNVPLFRAIAVWLVAIVIVWAALRLVARSGRLCAPAAFGTIVVAALACAAMIAASVVWAVGGTTGRTTIPSQLHLLERLGAERRAFALRVDGWSRLPPRELPASLSIGMVRTPSGRSAGRETPAMFALPSLPAGDYRVTVGGGTRGWLMLGIARDQFALRTESLPAGPIDLRFPLPVRGLLISGDEDARRAVRELVIEPLRVLGPDERLTGEMGRRAVRYGTTTVFFLDERSYPEPEAFWVGGERDATVVIQPDVPRATALLRLRNAPVANRIVLEDGHAWQDVLQMAPGEEREVPVPLDTARGGIVLRVETSAGFRPSEHDEGNSDHRFLGVWVKVER